MGGRVGSRAMDAEVVYVARPACVVSVPGKAEQGSRLCQCPPEGTPKCRPGST